MAFRGRGGFPIRYNNTNVIEEDDIETYTYFGRRSYRKIDTAYIAIDIIATAIIVMLGLITYVATYKSTIIDPIESTKKLFINIYLIIIGMLLLINLTILVSNLLFKLEEILIKILVIISAISIISMMVFLGIKINLDTTYTKDKFKQLYTEQNISEKDNKVTKTKMVIGITGIAVKTGEEYYVTECLKLYDIFSVKAYTIIRNSSFT